jgi:hypothetical protein
MTTKAISARKERDRLNSHQPITKSFLIMTRDFPIPPIAISVMLVSLLTIGFLNTPRAKQQAAPRPTLMQCGNEKPLPIPRNAKALC